jgi:hypothetical protein
MTAPLHTLESPQDVAGQSLAASPCSLIPFTERVNAISVNPEMATLKDIAEMAAELQSAWISLFEINKATKADYGWGKAKEHEAVRNWIRSETSHYPLV